MWQRNDPEHWSWIGPKMARAFVRKEGDGFEWSAYRGLECVGRDVATTLAEAKKAAVAALYP